MPKQPGSMETLTVMIRPSTPFFKTLEGYKEAAYKNVFVILGTGSDYYRFLKTIPQ